MPRVRWAILDAVRSGAKAVAHEAQLEDVVSEAPDPEQLFLAREGVKRLLARVDALPERERNLLRAQLGEGRRLGELAGREGISKSWASQLRSRAVDALRASELRDREMER